MLAGSEMVILVRDPLRIEDDQQMDESTVLLRRRV